ncbi:AAA family ATPase [Persicimonas caeni]|nr:DUF3696 domain-containing protein [Persicimonas caeni]
MITAITLENFRAIREPIRIDIAPITLLFGANGVGKSAVIKALHFAGQQLGVERFETFGEELGEFVDCVHGQTTERDIRIGVEACYSGPFEDLSFDQVIQEAAATFDLDIGEPSFWDFWDSFGTAAVDIEVGQRTFHHLQTPHMRTTAGVPAAQFVRSTYAGNSTRGFDRQVIELHPQRLLELMDADQVPAAIRQHVNQWVESSGVGDASAEDGWVELGWAPGRSFTADSALDTSVEVSPPVKALLLTPFHLVRESLYEFLHVGPLRERPPREERTAGDVDMYDQYRWFTGAAAWDALHHASVYQRVDDKVPLIERVNEWLASPERLGLGLSLRVNTAREVPLEALSALEQTPNKIGVHNFLEAVSNTPAVSHFEIEDRNRGIGVQARDHGTGVSQLVPLVVAAHVSYPFDSPLVAIEQPELHVHPAVQASLGDLFVVQRGKTSRRFMVETHSEHLLLRLMRRIRETYEQKLPRPELTLSSQDVAVYYVEQRDGTAEVSRLVIDEDGDFRAGWPAGFFAERAEELF